MSNFALEKWSYTALVAGSGIAVYLYQGFQVGAARVKYNIKAPATTGNENFERVFRVHQNTGESMGAWLPSLAMFSTFVSPVYGALIGVLWPIGRIIYGQGYVESPEKRELGFQISFSSTSLLLLGGLIGAGKLVYQHLPNHVNALLKK
mmetsp:Transcript_25081/g.35138  ORF Transcript_25081/g.35138 Transcript_25081/m.35138 type:complete len:149 (-) Transcript_25081:76-522(-)|eukprot:CAMPEP_0168569756 /NCGR_PEP_ID=MMETSP0413-20121227/16346_1 /TAXON_ID=136452 /ORGANISM="Filamoeba nolandi, Strain NC-AS-23-1" /LENGTH=148 /DNA_ID=CAMNT_0008602311 /DNA_START=44 /DNA_END=490 /DNA_ORIENTATION=+